jgi:hypothetical protein
MQCSAYRDVFSEQHLKSIIEFIGIKELPVLIHQLSEHAALIVSLF